LVTRVSKEKTIPSTETRKTVKGNKISTAVRRITRVGDSPAIILPKDWLEKVGLKPGDEVAIIYNKIIKIVPMDEHL